MHGVVIAALQSEPGFEIVRESIVESCEFAGGIISEILTGGIAMVIDRGVRGGPFSVGQGCPACRTKTCRCFLGNRVARRTLHAVRIDRRRVGSGPS